MHADVSRFMLIVFSKFAWAVSLRTLLNQTDNLAITGSMMRKNSSNAAC